MLEKIYMILLINLSSKNGGYISHVKMEPQFL